VGNSVKIEIDAQAVKQQRTKEEMTAAAAATERSRS
jgi:hypothetical protein